VAFTWCLKGMRLLVTTMLCGLLSVSVATAPLARVRYVMLPARAIDGVVGHQGTWAPTKGETADLEASVGQISLLPIEGWPTKLHIEHPENYYRQYVPIIRDGHRLVYVNAFCDDPPPRNWRTKLVVFIDGATCCWQAFYDPATKKYSRLRINARA